MLYTSAHSPSHGCRSCRQYASSQFNNATPIRLSLSAVACDFLVSHHMYCELWGPPGARSGDWEEPALLPGRSVVLFTLCEEKQCLPKGFAEHLIAVGSFETLHRSEIETHEDFMYQLAALATYTRWSRLLVCVSGL
jgi:hypothetical protein